MRLSTPIDATKYDIRVLWTGLKEEHVSADAGVVEGYPLDPPDIGPWQLVEFGIETTKDADRYWTLWIRPKSKGRGTAKKQKERKAEAKEKKPRTRRPRQPSPPEQKSDNTEAAPETN
jgi:hypothetical protein